MKESVLDVLMYLFEHYVDEDADLETDRDALHSALLQAGFPESEVAKAHSHGIPELVCHDVWIPDTGYQIRLPRPDPTAARPPSFVCGQDAPRNRRYHSELLRCVTWGATHPGNRTRTGSTPSEFSK